MLDRKVLSTKSMVDFMVSAYSRRIRVLGVALLLSVLFLGVTALAYAEEYVFILKWGSSGTGDGQFNDPWGVAVDGSGNVYIADTLNHRVQKFGPSYTLTITATAGGTTNPSPGNYTYLAGTVVDVSATPDTDYLFDHWELDGTNVGATDSINVTMDQNHSLHAVFVPAPPPAPTIESSDAPGNVTNVFDIPDTVHVIGNGYSASTTYDLYIVEDQATWTDGMTIPTRVPGTATTVTSNASGNIPPSAVWSPPLTPGNYDIVVDVNGNGAYDVDVDTLDDSDIQITAGFNVIPEFPSGIMALASMMALVAYIAILKSGPERKYVH